MFLRRLLSSKYYKYILFVGIIFTTESRRMYVKHMLIIYVSVVNFVRGIASSNVSVPFGWNSNFYNVSIRDFILNPSTDDETGRTRFCKCDTRSLCLLLVNKQPLIDDRCVLKRRKEHGGILNVLKRVLVIPKTNSNPK